MADVGGLTSVQAFVAGITFTRTPESMVTVEVPKSLTFWRAGGDDQDDVGTRNGERRGVKTVLIYYA